MSDNHYESLEYCNGIAYEDVVCKVDMNLDDNLMGRNVGNLLVVLSNTFLRISHIRLQPKQRPIDHQIYFENLLTSVALGAPVTA